jgi:hypothetical protein
MAAAIPLKIIVSSGEVHQFASTETVSSDGIEPRSGSILTLGGTSTSVLNLTQGAGADTASMFVGTTDPSAGGGVTANPGSLYLRNNGGGGEVWLKTGAGNTAWSQPGGGGSTLQAAYNAGNTISVVAATGTISLSNSTDLTPVVTIDRTFVGDGAGLLVTMGSPGGAAVTGRGINVTMGTGSTAAGIGVTQSGAGATSSGLVITSSGATGAAGIALTMGASTTGSGITITQNGTAAASNGITVTHTGTTNSSFGISITQAGVTNASTVGLNISVSNASAAGNGLAVSHAGSGVAVSVTSTGSGTGLYVSNTGTGSAFVVKDGANNVVEVNGSGNVAYTPTSGQSFTVDVLGAGAVSIDVAAASNFTVSGATADLTLGARAATITLNETGQTTLTGFTATSLVGALNELKAAGGSSIKDLVLNATNTGTSPLVIGAVYLTNAVVYGTSSRALIGTSAGGTATLKLRRQSTGVLVTGASWAVTGALADVALGSPITVPATDWYTIELLGDAGGTVSLAYGLTLVV